MQVKEKKSKKKNKVIGYKGPIRSNGKPDKRSKEWKEYIKKNKKEGERKKIDNKIDYKIEEIIEDSDVKIVKEVINNIEDDNNIIEESNRKDLENLDMMGENSYMSVPWLGGGIQSKGKENVNIKMEIKNRNIDMNEVDNDLRKLLKDRYFFVEENENIIKKINKFLGSIMIEDKVRILDDLMNNLTDSLIRSLILKKGNKIDNLNGKTKDKKVSNKKYIFNKILSCRFRVLDIKMNFIDIEVYNKEWKWINKKKNKINRIKNDDILREWNNLFVTTPYITIIENNFEEYDKERVFILSNTNIKDENMDRLIFKREGIIRIFFKRGMYQKNKNDLLKEINSPFTLRNGVICIHP